MVAPLPVIPSVEKQLELSLAPPGRRDIDEHGRFRFAMNGHRIVPALSLTNQPLATTTVVQELPSFGKIAVGRHSDLKAWAAPPANHWTIRVGL